MAQFRANILGQRGGASRLGSAKSGILAIVNGWHGGVTVEAKHVDGRDIFEIYATGGSGDKNTTWIGCVDQCGNFFPAMKVQP